MRVEPGPFELGAVGGGGPAVLCLHGLSGTPYEVRSPAEALAAAGFACLGPLLPGHGRSPEELSGTPRQSWKETASAAFDRLRTTHSRVYLLGLSMGGVLALWLCARRPVAGAVVMAAPLELRRLVRLGLPFVSRWLSFLPARSDIRDLEALAIHPSFDRMPLRAVRELVELGREVGSELSRVAVPLRLIYSQRDRVVPISNAARIQRGVRGSSELCVLEHSGHVMPVDRERERVRELAVEFLCGLEGRH